MNKLIQSNTGNLLRGVFLVLALMVAVSPIAAHAQFAEDGGCCGNFYDVSVPTGNFYDVSVPQTGNYYDVSVPQTGNYYDASVPQTGNYYDVSVPQTGNYYDVSVPNSGTYEPFGGTYETFGGTYESYGGTYEPFATNYAYDSYAYSTPSYGYSPSYSTGYNVPSYYSYPSYSTGNAYAPSNYTSSTYAPYTSSTYAPYSSTITDVVRDSYNTCTSPNTCNTTVNSTSITPVSQTLPQYTVQSYLPSYSYPTSYSNYNYPYSYNYPYNYGYNYGTNYSNMPYVALTQIPYTGFDFGPFGNAMYWLMLVGFAFAAAYLILYYMPRLVGSMRGVRGTEKFVATMAPVVAFAESVTQKKFVAPVTTFSGTKDSMNAVPSKNGLAPRIVISRS